MKCNGIRFQNPYFEKLKCKEASLKFLLWKMKCEQASLLVPRIPKIQGIYFNFITSLHTIYTNLTAKTNKKILKRWQKPKRGLKGSSPEKLGYTQNKYHE